MRTIFLCLLLSAVGVINRPMTPALSGDAKAKALIVYFSWGGNTRVLAKQMAELVGADLFELVPAEPYTRNRDEIEEVSEREIREGYQPKLAAMPENLEQYDVIYVGSPCWFATIAPPVASFLATADLEGKVVAPFMTHEGSRMGRSIADIKRLAPKARVTEGLPVYGSRVEQAEAEIKAWLKKIDGQRSKSE